MAWCSVKDAKGQLYLYLYSTAIAISDFLKETLCL